MTNHGIDWDKLRVFKVVAELGSMTSAAARLKESPPTVSRKIDELEQFLSSKLFTRSTRGMELTETGKTVLRYARQMEESANEVLSNAIGKSDGIEGRITIGTGDGVGPYWIAPRLAQFQAAHPKAQVRMHIQEQEPDLLNDEADIAIQFTEPRDPEIISHKLGTLHYIGFASQGYLDAQPNLPSSLFEYYQYRCILHESYVRQVERWAPKAHELKKMIDFAFVTNSASAMIALCRQGGGIALLPTYQQDVYPDLVALDMSEVAPIQFWMAYTEQTRRSPLGNLMIEWIKSLFDKQVSPWFTDEFFHPKQRLELQDKASEKVRLPRAAG
jgi:DNA-binding transcriptional LysR family regulator